MALKLALGIHKKKFREKEFAWQTLCWAIGQHKDLYRSLSETMRASSSGSYWNLESRGQSWIPGTAQQEFPGSRKPDV